MNTIRVKYSAAAKYTSSIALCIDGSIRVVLELDSARALVEALNGAIALAKCGDIECKAHDAGTALTEAP